MIAIETKYLGPTDFRGSRIIARTDNGQRITVPYDHALSGVYVHAQAAFALIDANPLWGADIQSLTCAATREGYVFLFPGSTVIQREEIAA